ncbi:hypothetical protein CVT91_01580 [Candidatus Atribacteria bacterium HGW-Atribacteria-1]|nr:MAG: hypothetical protein CVT91_01580 [Candidatus Atribacteria bacterium HGW-Atribacteria-1]
MKVQISFPDHQLLSLSIPDGWCLYHLMNSFGYKESLYFAIVNNRIVPDTYLIKEEDKIDVHLVKLPIVNKETIQLICNNLNKNEKQMVFSSEIRESELCNNCSSISIINKRFMGFGLESNHYSLCDKCFSIEIEKRVMKTILWHQLVERGDRIFIPLSGEKDSSAVVYFLSMFRKRFNKFEMLAYTVDEGVGTYSQVRLEKAKFLCNLLGVPNRIDSFKKEYGYTLLEMIESIKKKGILLQHHPCYICNVLKNKMFQEYFRKNMCTKVAGSNNMTDQAERVLIALLYGMWDYTCGVGPKIYDAAFQKTGILILSEIDEKEIAIYLYINKIPYNRHEDCQCAIFLMKEMRKLQDIHWQYTRLGAVVRDTLANLEQYNSGTILFFMSNYKKYYSNLLQKNIPVPESKQCANCGRQFISRLSNQSICEACYILDYYKLV